MPGIVLGDWDYARCEYYAKNKIMPPTLTKFDKKAYKLAQKVRNEIALGPYRELRGQWHYALKRYNNAVINYRDYVGFLRSNGYNGCNYYWREDLYLVHIEGAPWRPVTPWNWQRNGAWTKIE